MCVVNVMLAFLVGQYLAVASWLPLTIMLGYFLCGMCCAVLYSTVPSSPPFCDKVLCQDCSKLTVGEMYCAPPFPLQCQQWRLGALTSHLPLPGTAPLPPDDSKITPCGSKDGPTVACREHRLPHDDNGAITGLEQGTMTRRNTDLIATGPISTGPDPDVLSGVLLVRRDSDVTAVGDAPEPVKLKDIKH